MPSANAGNEMPETANVMPSRSGQRLRQTAEATPRPMPMITDQIMLTSVSHRVGMKRLPISSETGCLLRIDSPKSPRAACVMKCVNWVSSGLSRPRSWRTSATVASSA